jgi:hypothetical protein
MELCLLTRRDAILCELIFGIGFILLFTNIYVSSSSEGEEEARRRGLPPGTSVRPPSARRIW